MIDARVVSGFLLGHDGNAIAILRARNPGIISVFMPHMCVFSFSSSYPRTLALILTKLQLLA